MFSAGDSFADAALWSETVKYTRSVLADLGSVKERLLVLVALEVSELNTNKDLEGLCLVDFAIHVVLREGAQTGRKTNIETEP